MSHRREGMLNQYADYLRKCGKEDSAIQSTLQLGENITARFGSVEAAPAESSVERYLELGNTIAHWNGFSTFELG